MCFNTVTDIPFILYLVHDLCTKRIWQSLNTYGLLFEKCFKHAHTARACNSWVYQMSSCEWSGGLYNVEWTPFTARLCHMFHAVSDISVSSVLQTRTAQKQPTDEMFGKLRKCVQQPSREHRIYSNKIK